MGGIIPKENSRRINEFIYTNFKLRPEENKVLVKLLDRNNFQFRSNRNNGCDWVYLIKLVCVKIFLI